MLDIIFISATSDTARRQPRQRNASMQPSFRLRAMICRFLLTTIAMIQHADTTAMIAASRPSLTRQQHARHLMKNKFSMLKMIIFRRKRYIYILLLRGQGK